MLESNRHVFVFSSRKQSRVGWMSHLGGQLTFQAGFVCCKGWRFNDMEESFVGNALIKFNSELCIKYKPKNE